MFSSLTSKVLRRIKVQPQGRKLGWKCRSLYGKRDMDPSTWKGWIRERGGVSSPWLSVPLGFLAGAFGSVVGVGGGVFLAPALCQACSLPPKVSSGTSLAAVVATGAFAGSHYAKEGCLDPKAAMVIALSAMLTAPIGARCTSSISGRTLRKALGTFLMGVAPTVPVTRYLRRSEIESEGDGDAAPSQYENLGFLAVTGATAGFASGLLGVGGGVLVTPALSLVTSMSQASVLGTALVAMVPPSIVGLLQHARMDHVRWKVASGLALGTAIGGALGSRLATRADEGVLEGIFCVGMAATGWRTFRSAR